MALGTLEPGASVTLEPGARSFLPAFQAPSLVATVAGAGVRGLSLTRLTVGLAGTEFQSASPLSKQFAVVRLSQASACLRVSGGENIAAVVVAGTCLLRCAGGDRSAIYLGDVWQGVVGRDGGYGAARSRGGPIFSALEADTQEADLLYPFRGAGRLPRHKLQQRFSRFLR